MKWNRIKAFILFLAGTMLLPALSGCDSPPKSLNVCVGTEPATIDPQLNASVDGATLISHAFEGLMKINENAEIIYGQAESFSVSEDGTVYTFILRDDIKWSDGQKVTADDFVYAWQRAVDPATGSSYGSLFNMIVNANEIMYEEKTPAELGVQALDERTLEITLTGKCAYFPEICALPVSYPVRRDIIEQYGDQWTQSPESYICNGPYCLSVWEHNAYMLFTRNQNFYDTNKLGPVSIRFELMGDQSTILAAYKTGEIVFAEECPAEEIPAMTESGDLNICGQLGVGFVCFNTTMEPFDDPLVRKAFSLVIDRNFITDKVTRGGESPANGYVPSGISDVETTQEFRQVGGSFINTNEDEYAANCEEARMLLAEAGYPDGEGFPLIEYTFMDYDTNRDMAEALQNMWRTELGVSVSLVNQDWAVLMENIFGANYAVSFLSFTADYNNPSSLLDIIDDREREQCGFLFQREL